MLRHRTLILEVDKDRLPEELLAGIVSYPAVIDKEFASYRTGNRDSYKVPIHFDSFNGTFDGSIVAKICRQMFLSRPCQRTLNTFEFLTLNSVARELGLENALVFSERLILDTRNSAILLLDDVRQRIITPYNRFVFARCSPVDRGLFDREVERLSSNHFSHSA